MKKLTDEIAIRCAEKFVQQHYKAFESASNFNYYFVRVGQDLVNRPNDVFADTLPASDAELTSRKSAVEVFYDKCDYQTEYLIQVKLDFDKSKLKSEIVRRP